MSSPSSGYLYHRYALGVFSEVVNYDTAGGLGNHWVLNFGYAF